MSALYDVSTLGTVNNFITFNDYNATPVYRVRQTRPLRREVREQDLPLLSNSGVADYQTYLGKSYFVIEGQMYPYGEDEYYRGREKLRNVASLEIAQADPLSDYGYVPYDWTESSRQRRLWVKPEYVDGLGENTNTGFQQKFAFYCKVKNPVVYDKVAVTTTIGLDTTGTVVGASGYPLAYPVSYGKTTYSVGGTVNNAGTLATYPAINFYGPITKPRLTNVTTGEFIEVDVNLATGADTLSIAYDADTPPIVLHNGVSVYNKVTTGSTFLKVKPGTNSLIMTGTTISNGAYATVSFYSAYPWS